MMDVGAFVPPDCSGLCLPDSGPNSVDLLRGVAARDSASRIYRLVCEMLSQTPGPDQRKLLQLTARNIDDLGPIARSSLFDPLPACADAPAANSYSDAIRDPRSLAARALGAARYLIATPEITPLSLVLPPSAVPDGGLYLPHLKALLLPLGPVAVVRRDASVRFTWPDGRAVTLPAGDPQTVERVRGQRIIPLPRIEGFPVFNTAEEIAQATEAFGICQPSELPEALSRISEGIQALRSIWPAAAVSLIRHVKGFVILRCRGYSRSHSPGLFQGMILLSAEEDPITVGDLLVHELSHVRLNLFRQFDVLFEDRDPERQHISPWRSDPRPLIGLVLGVHAFLNVCHYYRRVACLGEYAASAKARFDRQRQKVRAAWNTAKPFILPTKIGANFFQVLEQEVMAL